MKSIRFSFILTLFNLLFTSEIMAIGDELFSTQRYTDDDGHRLENIGDYAKRDYEIVTIQSVSTTKRSFIIRRGRSEGIHIGQEAVFTTPKVSIAARCKAVDRHFSIWEPSDPQAVAPFERLEFVTLNHSLETVWSKISRLDGEMKSYLIERERERVLRPHFWALKVHATYALSDIRTEQAKEQEAQRQDYQIEGQYTWHFTRQFELGFGIRYDRSIAYLDGINISIPTYRLLGVTDLTYHFDFIADTSSNFYFGLGVGAGRSETITESSTASESVSTGITYVLPFFKIGFQTPYTRSTIFNYEIGLEAITSTENFDGDKTVDNDTLAAKISFGIKF